jgi:hypothetical protein
MHVLCSTVAQLGLGEGRLLQVGSPTGPIALAALLLGVMAQGGGEGASRCQSCHLVAPRARRPREPLPAGLHHMG